MAIDFVSKNFWKRSDVEKYMKEQSGDERYWHKFFIEDKDANVSLTDLLEMNFIELNKIKMKKMDEESALTLEIITQTLEIITQILLQLKMKAKLKERPRRPGRRR
jgi:hypothetical protein